MLRFRQYFNIANANLSTNYRNARKYTTKANDKRDNIYLETINLPKTKFPSRLNLTARSDVVKQLNEVK